MRRAAVCLAAAAVLAPLAGGATRQAPDLSAALASAVRATGAPGAQAAVFRCGRLVWAGAAGFADRRTRRPVTSETRFVLASVTKTYVATMVMRLVEDGDLALDTRLSRYYPALPNASRITVRMLLTHTSGLNDYEYGPAFAAHEGEPRHRWTRDEVLRGLGRPLFAPGTRFRYTNTNYVVLGGVIERAGGGSVERALQTGIGVPLGLRRTSFVEPSRGSSLFAHPYETRDDGSLADRWVPGHGLANDTYGPTWTDGGLATTATELARFGDGLFRGAVVSRATIGRMTALDRFGTGLGLYREPFDGAAWYGHSGSYGGFESELWHDPARGVTVAVVTNRDEPDGADDTVSDRIWVEVAGVYDDTAPAGGC